MKTQNGLISLLFILFINSFITAQDNLLIESFKSNNLVAVNRNISIDSLDNSTLFINAKKGDGLAIIKDKSFTTGVIEIDISGKDIPGRSFVGIAFNIQNDSTYEAIYFRPFNFKAKQQIRKNHMIQYIYHPEYTWHKLRKERTGVFEKELIFPPKPNDWFHVKIMINDKEVRVFVNGNQGKPDLVIERLATSKSDKIGLWTGNNSSGRFKNIKIIK